MKLVITGSKWLQMVRLAMCVGLTIGSVHAQKPEKIVVTAFGGVWTESVKKNFVPCFEKKTGVRVDVLTGDSAEWLNRIRANPRKPQIDVVTLGESDSMRAAREGLLDQMSVTKVPSLSEIPERFYRPWDDQAAVVNFGAMGVIYNKGSLKSPPRNWKELIENIAAGRYGKKIAWPAGTFTWGPEFMWFVAQQYDGNIDTAFRKIKAMQPYVVKFWSNPVEALNLFATKEVDILVLWDGRANVFIEQGNRWAAFYVPEPNTMAVSVLVSKVKNSPDVAWEYVNCVLSAEGQLGHAKTLLYSVGNQTVVYPPNVKDKVTSASRVVIAPYKDILDKIPAWTERWNKEIR